MNQPTAIIVKDGMGRRENPFSPYDPIHAEGSYLSRFDDFALNNQSHPCPSIANTAPGKTILAELRWQKLHPMDISKNRDWQNVSANEDIESLEKQSYMTRQIWVPIVEQKEGEGKFGEYTKVIDRLPDTPNDICGNKASDPVLVWNGEDWYKAYCELVRPDFKTVVWDFAEEHGCANCGQQYTGLDRIEEYSGKPVLGWMPLPSPPITKK